MARLVGVTNISSFVISLKSLKKPGKLIKSGTIIASCKRMQRLPLLFHFYQNFIVLTTAINLISGFLIRQSNSASYIMAFGLVKIITNFLTGVLYHIFRRESLYYYNNLGQSTLSIYTSVMILDLIIWLSVVILFKTL